MKTSRPVFLFMTRAGKICMATDSVVSIYEGPVETLFGHVRKAYTTIYTTGLACNMWFATALYTACVDKVDMFMLGPQHCGPSICNDIPQRTLHAMRCCRVAGSQGGWVHVTPHVLVAMQCSADTRVDVRSKLHLQLPFWRDVSFIDNVDGGAITALVGQIVDPRWFLTEDNPAAYRRLFVYLGLTPGDMRLAVDSGCSSIRLCRCRVALSAWKRDDTSPPVGDLTAGQFLWEIWRRYDDPVMGDLRATQAFVQYFARVWHKRLFADNHPHSELLFVPQTYFTEAVAAAYEKHVLAVR